MLNYAVDAGLLLPFIPAGTELDRWNKKNIYQPRRISIFSENEDVRVTADSAALEFRGEMNLRFYVRRQAGNEVRRGVVFIREMVPLITWRVRGCNS